MKKVEISPEAMARFRAAASQFAQKATSPASRLLSVRDDIAALRAKGASFRTISELLKRCGISASDTCVLRFCQRVLGEAPTHASRAAPRATPVKNTRATKTATRDATAGAKTTPPPPAAPVTTEADQIALLDDLLSVRPESPARPSTHGGPRIARIEFAQPENPDQS